MIKFPENSLLQTIKKGFMNIFCSLYQIGSHLQEKVDRLRLSHQTRTSRNALWGLFCNTLNQTHLSNFTAVPRGSMDLSVFLYSIINFPCSREQWPLQEIILYSKLLCPKVATIKRFNGINAKWLLNLSSTWNYLVFKLTSEKQEPSWIDLGFLFILNLPIAMNHLHLGPLELFKGKIQNKNKHIITGACLFFPVDRFFSIKSISDVYQRFVSFL